MGEDALADARSKLVLLDVFSFLRAALPVRAGKWPGSPVDLEEARRFGGRDTSLTRSRVVVPRSSVLVEIRAAENLHSTFLEVCAR